MRHQRRLLPSTSMLLAFDAAARTESFTEAANELNLTQGAISRQVRALENQLDVVLFNRVRKSVCLTEAGKRYADEIEKALQIIRLASLNAMTDQRGGTLNLAILPTFGTRWLIPRFPAFLQMHPDITVNFASKFSPFDFKKENLHAAIHFGRSDWPDTVSTFLMREETLPVGSPSLLENRVVKEASDLSDVPLLHLETRPQAWSEWFEACGLKPPTAKGMVFEEISTIAQATVAGLGVALLPRFLIESELESGDLAIALDRPLKSTFAYYLVTPADKVDYAPLVAFKEWLLEIILNGGR